MTQPISGRNMLPQSLEVSKVEQLRSTSNQEHQQQLAVKQEQLHQERQKQVNRTDQSEGSRIRSDEESSGKKQDLEQRKKSTDDEKDTKEEKASEEKGHIIDIRV